KSSMGSRRGGSKLRSFSEFRRAMIGRARRGGKPSRLFGAVGEAVLAEVVGEVPRVDPEHPGRFLAHASRAALRLDEEVALQAGERPAEVQVARPGRLERARVRGGRGQQVEV